MVKEFKYETYVNHPAFKEPIRQANDDFSQTELSKVILTLPLEECTIKFYDPETGEESNKLISRYHWELLHNDIDRYSVHSVRLDETHAMVLYYLKIGDDLNKISKYIQYGKNYQKYITQYSYV